MNIVTREFIVSRHPDLELYAVEELFKVFDVVADTHYHGEDGFYFTDIRKASVLRDLLEEENELKGTTVLENRFAVFLFVCLMVFLLSIIIKF
jgi:hypothetical protein